MKDFWRNVLDCYWRYKSWRPRCTGQEKNIIGSNSNAHKKFSPTWGYSIYNAVYIIAHALHALDSCRPEDSRSWQVTYFSCIFHTLGKWTRKAFRRAFELHSFVIQSVCFSVPGMRYLSVSLPLIPFLCLFQFPSSHNTQQAIPLHSNPLPLLHLTLIHSILTPCLLSNA